MISDGYYVICIDKKFFVWFGGACKIICQSTFKSKINMLRVKTFRSIHSFRVVIGKGSLREPLLLPITLSPLKSIRHKHDHLFHMITRNYGSSIESPLEQIHSSINTEIHHLPINNPSSSVESTTVATTTTTVRNLDDKLLTNIKQDRQALIDLLHHFRFDANKFPYVLTTEQSNLLTEALVTHLPPPSPRWIASAYARGISPDSITENMIKAFLQSIDSRNIIQLKHITTFCSLLSKLGGKPALQSTLQPTLIKKMQQMQINSDNSSILEFNDYSLAILCKALNTFNPFDKETYKLVHSINELLQNTTFPFRSNLNVTDCFLCLNNLKMKHNETKIFMQLLITKLNDSTIILQRHPMNILFQGLKNIENADPFLKSTYVTTLTKQLLASNFSFHSSTIKYYVHALQYINNQDPNSFALIQVLTDKIQQSSCTFSVEQIAYIFNGLRSLDINQKSTLSLINALTDKMEQSEWRMTGPLLEDILFCLHQLKVNDNKDYIKLIQLLTNRIEQSSNELIFDNISKIFYNLSSFHSKEPHIQRFLSVICDALETSSLSNKMELDAKRIAMACHSLSTLDDQCDVTNRLYDILANTINQSHDTIFTTDTASLSLHALYNITGKRFSEKKLINALVDKLEQSNITFENGYQIGSSCFGLRSISRHGPVINRLVDTISTMIDRSNNIILSSNNINSICFGIRALNGLENSTYKLVDALTKKLTLVDANDITVETLSILCYTLNGLNGDKQNTYQLIDQIIRLLQGCKQSFNQIFIADAFYGLQNVNGSHSSTIQLVKELTKQLKQLPYEDKDDSFMLSMICYYGLRNLNGNEESTKELVNQLTHMINKSTYEFDAKAISRIGLSLRSLDGQDNDTKLLVKALTNKIIQSNAVFSSSTIGACSGLRNLDGDDKTTHDICMVLAEKITQATKSLTPYDFAHAVYGLKNLHGKYKSTQTLVYSLTDHLATTEMMFIPFTLGMTCSGIHGLDYTHDSTKLFLLELSKKMIHSMDQTLSFNEKGINDLCNLLQYVDNKDIQMNDVISAITHVINNNITNNLTNSTLQLLSNGLYNIDETWESSQRLLQLTCKWIIDSNQQCLQLNNLLPLYKKLLNDNNKYMLIDTITNKMKSSINDDNVIVWNASTINSFCYYIKDLDWNNLSTMNYIQTLADKIKLSCNNNAMFLSSFSLRDIGFMCCGLHQVNGNHESTIALIDVITDIMEQCPENFTSKVIGNICYGMKQFDFNHETTKRFISVLIKKIEESTAILNDPTIALLCIGLHNVNGKDEITKQLVKCIINKIQTTRFHDDNMMIEDEHIKSIIYHGIKHLEKDDQKAFLLACKLDANLDNIEYKDLSRRQVIKYLHSNYLGYYLTHDPKLGEKKLSRMLLQRDNSMINHITLQGNINCYSHVPITAVAMVSHILENDDKVQQQQGSNSGNNKVVGRDILVGDSNVRKAIQEWLNSNEYEYTCSRNRFKIKVDNN